MDKLLSTSGDYWRRPSKNGSASMALQYIKHEAISLRRHSEFSEAWLHDRIANDTSILGLGELDVIGKELALSGGGRLDMLLADFENGIRYEIEIMLGATDPSHIIRTLEYWDLERRRYPAYDHVAVLVAEDVTSRFLNVMSLLAGSIPLVAIQLSALRVGEQVLLHFVKVLDQRQLREDTAAESAGEEASRATWDKKIGVTTMQVCDRVAAIANEVADPPLELRYKKTRVTLGTNGSFFNRVLFWPKKNFVWMRIRVSNAEQWISRLQDANLEAVMLPTGKIEVSLQSQDLVDAEPLVRDLVHETIREQHD